MHSINSQVHKFGGTCLASAERIDAVCRYLVETAGAGPKLVVLSAMGSHPSSPIKVTDLLLGLVAKAGARDAAYLLELEALEGKHADAARALLGADSPELAEYLAVLRRDMANLSSILHTLSIARMSAEPFEDFVVGHGELWCAQLAALRCRQLGAGAAAVFLDARDVLTVRPTSDGMSVDVEYEVSGGRLDAWARERAEAVSSPDALILATGFIAQSPDGRATTLKRNGSDYSATTFGALLRAGRITIWTDVDGVFSADPRKVPEAVCLRRLSYHEAWEMSYFGANVLHPRTALPAMRHGIPVTSRNFFNLADPGTVICDPEDADVDGDATGVKGFATIDDVALVNVEGTGMVGVHGTAAAIFATIRDAGVNVIMISQASSEHSVCFAVRSADADRAVAALRARFADAIAAGRISSVDASRDCCVLAAVGRMMASRRGVAATMFAALAQANINVRAIAQGSSEYNITALVDAAESTRALRAVHGRFYMQALPIGLALVGPGLIGATFLAQLRDQAAKLRDEYHLDIRVLAIAGSKRMLLARGEDSRGIDLASWRARLDGPEAEPTDLDALAGALTESFVPNVAVVDCTASEAPSTRYLDWMARGIHIITPNKKMNSGDLARYRALKRHQRSAFTHFLYEATVGAGLPVIATLQHLVQTGDRVRRIEGIFSGTLSYIFNTFGTDDRPFSAVVAAAREQGFTEPDPRDDLAGTDVARKVTILAREAGLPLELEQVPVQSLVPEPLRDIPSADDFMARLPEFDADMDRALREAREAGECLRFVGVVDADAGQGRVELKRYPTSHPFAQLSGSDNIIAFTTQRYSAQPLIIRGPGAGAEVTAGGVFSDLLRLAAYLGAPS